MDIGAGNRDGVMASDELKQRDLSHLSIREMDREERAEMRRRYEVFVQTVLRPPPAPRDTAPARPLRRWHPGMTR
jgi:hypothetical protein